VGRSAAGKTTLANLMLGLYHPTSGRILFDGKVLTSLEARSVRSQLGVVTQQTHLFGGTIYENIALVDPELGREAVEAAARLAHIHDEIMAMPMGYYTILSEGGLSIRGAAPTPRPGARAGPRACHPVSR
jgi:ABC-type bacteriocin/lantibiotic exporter with double-glycine peptidase domain